ncbi:VanW family protein [Candidatus Daviesbacteria bacterium]|nr:VanW family protein [Candidatus Daviesbacteria bacterium]MBI4038060.1 VanW family protein [Candidatus Daviesbacteria bacterium]
MKKPIQIFALIPLTFGSLLGVIGNDHLLAYRQISLDNRQPDRFVNDVFKKNILLNLAYMEGRVNKASDINWDEIEKPFRYEFKLLPNKTFAFHSDVKAEYKDLLVKTTNAHFNAAEGFKTDGYLFGDGVCHLASLINWVAKDAGLSVEAPTNHNFANIPDVPKEFGVSIYSNPFVKGSSTLQNLYITNNKAKPISFRFEYNDNKVKVSVVELN